MTIPLDASTPRDRSWSTARAGLPFGKDDDAKWLEAGIIERFCSVAASRGDEIAIDDGSTRLRYGELKHAIFHLAQRIRETTPPGRNVAIWAPNGACFPVAMLACMAAGHPFVPLDCSNPAERNVDLATDARVGLVLTTHGSAGAKSIDGVKALEIEPSLLAKGDPPCHFARSDAALAILFTSGSTTRPKGVCYDEPAILERVW